MPTHSIIMQSISIDTRWTPAQFTLLWFMNGIKPSDGAFKILIDDVEYNKRHIHINYFSCNNEYIKDTTNDK